MLKSVRTIAGITCLLFWQLVLADASDFRISKAERVGMAGERLERIGMGMRRLIDAEKIPGITSLTTTARAV